MHQPDLIAIFGPTAIGKTAVAIELADLLRERGENPVAVSVDSMQVYRELPVITGAPDADELARLEHRLIGEISATEEWDVASHAARAHAEIDSLRASGRQPLVVGGTGLYLRAALTELDLLPPPTSELRAHLEAEHESLGQGPMYDRLVELDPETAASIAPGDPRRTLRALEALEQGASPSDRSENRLWTADVRVPTQLFALVMDRKRLYELVERRVDAMVESGAIAEVRAVAAASPGRTARQALGYDELLAGDVEKLKINTRRYAKRQLTWLRKLAGARVIDVTGREAADVAYEIAAATVAASVAVPPPG